METFLLCFPTEATHSFINSGLLTHLLQHADLPLPTPNPNQDDEEENNNAHTTTQTLTQHLSLLARCLLSTPHLLVPFLLSHHLDLLLLADAWLVHFDDISSSSSSSSNHPPTHPCSSTSSASSRRKLWCLSLLFLLGGGGGGGGGGGEGGLALPLQQHLVGGCLDRLELILNVCVDVLAEAKEEEKEKVVEEEEYGERLRGTGSGHLHGEEARVYEEELLLEGGGGEGGGGRGVGEHPGLVMVVERKDVVWGNKEAGRIRGWMEEALGRARRVVGEQAVAEAIGKVHPEILGQL